MEQAIKRAYKIVIKDLRRRSPKACPKCDFHDYDSMASELEELLADNQKR